MEENATREQKSKFVESARKIFEEFKLEQAKKFNDGKITIEELSNLELGTKFQVIETIFASYELVTLEQLRDGLCKQIGVLELGDKEEQESLSAKVQQAYKEAKEPSKLDSLRKTASSAVDTLSGAAGTAKKKFMNVLPRALKGPPPEESLRAVELSSSASSVRLDSPLFGESTTPPASKKKQGRRKRADSPNPIVGSIGDELSRTTREAEEQAEKRAAEIKAQAEVARKAKEAADAELKRQEAEAAERKKLEEEAEKKQAEEAERKTQETEVAELKRLAEETAQKQAEEAERNRQQIEAQRMLEEKQKEENRLREEEKLKTEARLKAETDERNRLVAEAKRVEDDRRLKETMARVAAQKDARKVSLQEQKTSLEGRNTALQKQIDDKEQEIRAKNEEVGRSNTAINQTINNFYTIFIQPELEAKRNALVPFKLLFGTRLAMIKSESETYTREVNTAVGDEAKERIKAQTLNKLVNVGIYSFEFVRNLLSSSYHARRSVYSAYLNACESAGEARATLDKSKEGVEQAAMSFTMHFSSEAQNRFNGTLMPGEEALDSSKPVLGVKQQLIAALNSKELLGKEIRGLEEQKRFLLEQQRALQPELAGVRLELEKYNENVGEPQQGANLVLGATK